MIVFRYLAKEVLVTMSAVSGAVLLIIMSGRFVKYLAQAASGQLSADVLFLIMGFRLPGFLELVLPLGFFIGVLLAYGRLYTDNEMTVLFACGMSRKKLVGYTMLPALVVAALVGCFSLYLGPLGFRYVENILVQQSNLTELDTLTPGRFQSQGPRRVIYTEKLSDDRLEMKNVFISMASKKAKKNQASEDEGAVTIVVAESGRQEINKNRQSRYLVLSDGARYEGMPGEADYRILKFKRYGQLIENPQQKELQSLERDAIPTMELFKSELVGDKATLQWRVSLPLLVLVLALLAVPLSHTNPRQGRYAKLIPALLIYVFYLVILNGARDAVEDGKLSAAIGVWWVHSIFMVLALILLGQESMIRRWRYKKISVNEIAK